MFMYAYKSLYMFSFTGLNGLYTLKYMENYNHYCIITRNYELIFD